MFDAPSLPPDLGLLLSPEDEAEFAGSCRWTTPARRTEPSSLFVVLHRRHGAWTHAYRVVASHRPGQLLIHLLRVAEGDQRPAMHEWMAAEARRHGAQA